MGPIKTPLRYPGGKQRLAPFIVEVLIANKITQAHYVEPYAGGAGAAFELLLNKKVSKVYLNDSSRAIYAFWYSVLNYTDELCRKIMSASLNIKEWRYRQEIVRNPSRHNLLELGFSTFYLNRCNRSGILSAGVIGGLNQDGNYKMDARFSRTELIEKIQIIRSYKKDIKIFNLDAEIFLKENDKNFPPNTLIYLDPPYFVKGSELYLNSYKKNDHFRLAQIIQKRLKSKWILSYDAHGEIIDAYRDRTLFTYDLQYNASKVYKGHEVFIFSDKVKIPSSSSIEYINEGLLAMK